MMSSPADANGLVSYCVECDALRGDCDHQGHRYLGPIVYEGEGRPGYRVPDHERERWNNPPRIGAAAKPAEQPRELHRLVVELEAWIDLDGPLERALRAAYELEPLRVSRIVVSVIDKAERRELRNPAGLLWRRLRDIKVPA